MFLPIEFGALTAPDDRRKIHHPGSAATNLIPRAGLRRLAAFTLVELLVVIAIIAILAAILFPVFLRAKNAAKQSNCLSNLRNIGIAFELYMGDDDDRMPDRRDVKRDLRGSAIWSWPPSDPRAGWSQVLLQPYVRNATIWNCPSVTGSVLGSASSVRQDTSLGWTTYWLWRFDRMEADRIEVDNFWGKTPDQALADLQASGNPQAGNPQGIADVELAVDPYFPRTIPSVATELKGLTAHTGGRNRLLLDCHAKWMRDIRTNP